MMPALPVKGPSLVRPMMLNGRPYPPCSGTQHVAVARFTFLTVIPSELVVYNPMGILITYLQTDRALVTEPPR